MGPIYGFKTFLNSNAIDQHYLTPFAGGLPYLKACALQLS